MQANDTKICKNINFKLLHLRSLRFKKPKEFPKISILTATYAQRLVRKNLTSLDASSNYLSLSI